MSERERERGLGKILSALLSGRPEVRLRHTFPISSLSLSREESRRERGKGTQSQREGEGERQRERESATESNRERVTEGERE